MKKTLFSILILAPFFCQGQSLDFNNASAGTGHAPGILFTDFDPSISTSLSAYEVPKGSGMHTIFSTGVWCAATDANGQVKLAAVRYGQLGFDFFPGPISATNAYDSSAYVSAYGNLANFNASKWYITKTDIQNHQWNWNQAGYVMPQAIASWPGNGIANVGVAQNLAPFVDMNNNSLYEPALGDYPDIRGDAAYFMIMNDGKGIHTSSGGQPLGIEIHTMMYQYASSDYLDNTTFVNFRVFNRGTASYSNFKFGLFTDFNLGSDSDDLIGCDSTQNMMYVYNGDNNDEIGNGYGINPPAFGLVGLNKNMSHFCPYPVNGGGPQSPSTPAEMFSFMSGIWADGSPWTQGGNGYGGTQATNYVYPSNPNDANGWSELTEGNSPDNRRGVMIMDQVNLPAGGNECYDFAALFSRDQGNDNLQNVNALIALASTAKTDYDAMNFNCDQVTLNLESLDVSQIGLYPNPTSGKFTLSFGDQLITGEVIVTDMKGRVVLMEQINNKNVKILNLDTFSGIYNVSVITETNTVHKRLIKAE